MAAQSNHRILDWKPGGRLLAKDGAIAVSRDTDGKLPRPPNARITVSPFFFHFSFPLSFRHLGIAAGIQDERVLMVLTVVFVFLGTQAMIFLNVSFDYFDYYPQHSFRLFLAGMGMGTGQHLLEHQGDQVGQKKLESPRPPSRCSSSKARLRSRSTRSQPKSTRSQPRSTNQPASSPSSCLCASTA